MDFVHGVPSVGSAAALGVALSMLVLAGGAGAHRWHSVHEVPPGLLIVMIVSSAQDRCAERAWSTGGGTVSIPVIHTYRDTERRVRAE